MGQQVSSEGHFDYQQQLLSQTGSQSVEVQSDDHKDGETLPRRHPLAKDKLWIAAIPNENGGYRTVWDCFQRAVNKFPQRPAFGTRKYEYVEQKDGKVECNRTDYVWQSYEEVDKDVRSFASGLMALGCKAKDNIGIFSQNRAEWVTSALAFYSQNLRTVSLYSTLGPEAVEYIISHANVPVVIVSKENIKPLFAVLDKIKQYVKHIIQFDSTPLFGNVRETVDDADREKCKSFGIKLHGWNEVIQLGNQQPVFAQPADADDLAFIMYTSGTTGNPKGVMLTHANVVSAVSTVPTFAKFDEYDVLLSYLPLAHIFETVVEVAVIINGGAIGFFQGNVKKLADDMVAVRPTLFPGVPRIFNRFYEKIRDGVKDKSCIVRWYFNRAYNYQVGQIRQGLPRYQPYDDKVFKPIRAKLGLDRVKILISGAAPCSPEVLEFLKVVTCGASVLQGYGMTETSAASAVTEPNDYCVGHVGPPLPGVEIKLVDVPDMNYHATDKPCPRGEIWMRGPAIFQGYYLDDESTKSTLSNGWIATGDIGRWNPNGTLSIIDRKKNMFKLAQGEYVASEKIELEYQKSNLVGQIWVYGNSFKTFLLAVVVPNGENVSKLIFSKGWWPTAAIEPLGTDEFSASFYKALTGEHANEIKQMIMTDLKQYNKNLHGFEQVKDILIEPTVDKLLAGFNEANNCLTPTFKLRRANLLQRYLKQLKELYAKNGEDGKEKWPGEQ